MLRPQLLDIKFEKRIGRRFLSRAMHASPLQTIVILLFQSTITLGSKHASTAAIKNKRTQIIVQTKVHSASFVMTGSGGREMRLFASL